jgi:hypothetical protein
MTHEKQHTKSPPVNVPPEIMETRIRDAALVSELFDRSQELDTAARRESYERVKAWFDEKHGCDWQRWAPEKSERGR